MRELGRESVIPIGTRMRSVRQNGKNQRVLESGGETCPGHVFSERRMRGTFFGEEVVVAT